MLIFLVFPSQICPHSLWLLGRTTPVFKRLFFNAFSVDSSSVLFRGVSQFILEFGFLGAGTQRFYLFFFFLMGLVMTPKLIIIKNIFTFSNTLVTNNQLPPSIPPIPLAYIHSCCQELMLIFLYVQSLHWTLILFLLWIVCVLPKFILDPNGQ